MKGQDKKPCLSVTAGLIWKNGKVLITKRPKESHLEGFWEFPGGKQEYGESLRHCLEREIKEELGLNVKAGKHFLTVDHDYGSKVVSLHVINCSILDGEPQALQCQEIRWVDPYDFPRFVYPPPDTKVIEALAHFDKDLVKGYKMFYKRNDKDYRVVSEGMQLKTLVNGENTILCEFNMEKGRSVPSHKHPHEQTGYLVSGRMNLIIGDNTFVAGPGDSWCIPGDVEHAAEILENSVAVEVFSPVREDYLP